MNAYSGETTESIEMLFEMLGQVGQRNDILDGVHISSWELGKGQIFWGNGSV